MPEEKELRKKIGNGKSDARLATKVARMRVVIVQDEVLLILVVEVGHRKDVNDRNFNEEAELK